MIVLNKISYLILYSGPVDGDSSDDDEYLEIDEEILGRAEAGERGSRPLPTIPSDEKTSLRSGLCLMAYVELNG